jgi:hypothetical protein
MLDQLSRSESASDHNTSSGTGTVSLGTCKPAPQLVQFIYQDFLLARAGHQNGKGDWNDIDWESINGKIQPPYEMSLRCADGSTLRMRGRQRMRSDVTDHNHSAWYNEFDVDGYNEDQAGMGVYYEGVDKLVHQRGGPDLAQVDGMGMKAFVLKETARLPDIAKCGLDPHGKAVVLWPGSGASARRPRRYKNITIATALKLFRRYGVWLRGRKIGTYGGALGVSGAVEKLPQWLLDYARENRAELINALREEGWHCFNSYTRQWFNITPAQSPWDYRINEILKSQNSRDGLGDRFSVLWRLYLKFERWQQDIHTGPFELWWYRDNTRALKTRMEEALLKHPARDAATMQVQLKILQSRTEIGESGKLLIKRASRALNRLSAEPKHTQQEALRHAA